MRIRNRDRCSGKSLTAHVREFRTAILIGKYKYLLVDQDGTCSNKIYVCMRRNLANLDIQGASMV